MPTLAEVRQAPTGYIVVSRHLIGNGAVYPYQYGYDYTHVDTKSEAFELYAEYERGEYGNSLFSAIVPARNGVPCAEPLAIWELPNVRAA